MHADDDGPAVATSGVVVPFGHAVQFVEPATLHVPFPHGIADAMYEPARHKYPAGHIPVHVAFVKP